MGCADLSITPRTRLGRGRGPVSQRLLLCGAITKGAAAHLRWEGPFLCVLETGSRGQQGSGPLHLGAAGRAADTPPQRRPPPPP